MYAYIWPHSSEGGLLESSLGSVEVGSPTQRSCHSALSLYKIFVHFEAFMHESIIRVLPSPTCIAHNSAILLHDHCAIYDPPRPPLAYAIHHTILAMAISCKRQFSPPSLCHFVTQGLLSPVAVLRSASPCPCVAL